MTEYTIYSDLHMGAPHEIKAELEFREGSVFLGDIFDLKNCHKRDLESLTRMRHDAIEECSRTGGIYVTGNHSLEDNHLYDTRDGVLFMHGDLVQANPEKALTWRTRPAMGKSGLRWKSLGMFYNLMPKSIPLFDMYFRRASNIAYENCCHTVVMGHFHPKKMVEKHYNGKRIIVMPRGRHKIDV